MSNLQIDHQLGRTICFSLVVVDRWTTTLQFQLRSASHAESSILVVAEVIACLSARLNYVSACPAASGKFCPTPSPPLPFTTTPAAHVRVHGRRTSAILHRNASTIFSHYRSAFGYQFEISTTTPRRNPFLTHANIPKWSTRTTTNNMDNILGTEVERERWTDTSLGSDWYSGKSWRKRGWAGSRNPRENVDTLRTREFWDIWNSREENRTARKNWLREMYERCFR